MDRKALIERVAAQYLGRGEEDDNLPWMDYMLKKNSPPEGMKDTLKTVGDMVQHSDGVKPAPNTDGQLGQNLLDGVQDARSISHEQGYQPSNMNDDLGQGAGGLIPAEFNWSDPSDVPDDSIRLIRKNKQNQNNVTGTPWGSDLSSQEHYASNAPKKVLKKAFKNIHQVTEQSTHPRAGKVREEGKKLNPRNVSNPTESKQGIYTFDVEGKEGSHKVVLQLLQAKDKSNLLEHPCLLACDCDDFLYGGPQYYAVKGKYMYMPMFRPQLLEPRDVSQKGRGKGLTFCKHISSISSHLSDLGIDSDYSKDLQDSLMTITDDSFFDVVDQKVLDSKTKFVQFILDERLHKGVLDLGRKDLKSRGLREDQLFDYVQGTFSNRTEGVQKAIIEGFEENPSIIVMILLEYFKAFGTVPGYLYETAYNTIKQHIG